ncbi:CU044_5270 family protein [Streptomyces kunmingensis]|uniref:CU044_5270 family protein n=1 Tax=Streptomyces kunmingensis TaxID=68225 RepID=A0ABU6C1T4_9ACTN|nr:CU044_5270 family protein [Streptomyces kunmingensis]MEB3958673.1 CU044_5270 family protein [Streptomyces kunmingensis]
MTELPEKSLPPGRHELLKEHLMTEIRQSDAPAHASVHKKWLRPALAAASVATAAAVTFVFLPLSGEGANAQPPTKEAVALLEDIALAAAHENVPGGIRDDQFVYIESKVGYTTHQEGKKAKLDPVHKREVWLSVDGLHTGLIREPDYGFAGEEALKPDLPLYEGSTNYRNLQTLPTDPDAMLKWLHRVSAGGESKDQNTFVQVGDLSFESLMPAAQSAALYRAAAKIPGVVVVPDAVDAAGRRGVAVARVNDGERQELIFDKKTKQFLGERTVAVEDLPDGQKKGELTGSSAILERAVVDKPGQRP